MHQGSSRKLRKNGLRAQRDTVNKAGQVFRTQEVAVAVIETEIVLVPKMLKLL